MNKYRKAVDAICYLLSKLNNERVTPIKIIKLLSLADKYNICHNGKMVTNSPYFAMENGLVASYVKDALNVWQNKSDNIYIKNGIADEVKKMISITTSPDSLIYMKYMGETSCLKKLASIDRESIDFVVNRFGKMVDNDLIEYIHKFPEWEQYRAYFKDENSRKAIQFEELFTTIGDDFGISQETVDNLKNDLFC